MHQNWQNLVPVYILMWEKSDNIGYNCHNIIVDVMRDAVTTQVFMWWEGEYVGAYLSWAPKNLQSTWPSTSLKALAGQKG